MNLIEGDWLVIFNDGNFIIDEDLPKYKNKPKEDKAMDLGQFNRIRMSLQPNASFSAGSDQIINKEKNKWHYFSMLN